MRVLHFILGKANKERANGVNQVIAGLAKYCARHGADIRVVGKAEAVSREGERIVRDGFEVEAYSRWAGPLRAALREAIRWAQVVHLHGVFSPWNVLAGRICDEIGRPYIVTLHDGLAPERALMRSGFKKKLFHRLIQRRHLEHAAGIHVLTEEESTDLLKVTRPAHVFCIPNGIDLEDYPLPSKTPSGWSGRVNIGYLGRLSKEKNIEALCEAFARINQARQLRLQIAGPSSTYGQELLRRFSEHGVEGVGPKYGESKLEFIRALDLFVHPSLCDVFSITGMEVLAIGTPLLISRTSKVSYFFNRNAYFMCEPTSFGLERGLRQALDRSADWSAIAARGRQLIEDRLNWSIAAQDMLEAYDRILAGR
ncbi:MAG: glycosyltransferase [Candidatus Binatia bacterium]